MKVSKKIQTLKLLQKLYKINIKSATIYSIAARNEKRLLLSSFYSRLRTEKMNNAGELKIKIEELLKEITLDKEPLQINHKFPSKYSPSFLRVTTSKYFNQVYTRELKALYFYKKYLSRINRAELRGILMDHLHQVKQTISDMNLKGADKYSI